VSFSRSPGQDAIRTSIYVVRPSQAAISNYCKALRLRNERSAWPALARAIASSPGWSDLPPATLVVRLDPEPLIAILADWDQPWQQAWAEVQSRTLETALNRVRYLDYRDAERSVERLAGELVKRFGQKEVRRFRYTAIPRGGFIVLGMLAEVLDLSPANVVRADRASSPVVIVDDCALSGARFGAFLSTCPCEQVIFAHLYSHPQLRAAVEAREPRVLACLASSDLEDHGPDRIGGDYTGARKQWAERLGPNRYWLGDPDRICFPWNEPERLIWNPAHQSVETGWRIIPPELCLRGRGSPPPKVGMEIQPTGKGPLRPSGRSLFGHLGNETRIANLATGQSFRLEGSGADIWWALVEHGTRRDTVKALAQRYRIEESVLQSDVSSFAERLLEEELLEETSMEFQDLPSDG